MDNNGIHIRGAAVWHDTNPPAWCDACRENMTEMLKEKGFINVGDYKVPWAVIESVAEWMNALTDNWKPKE